MSPVWLSLSVGAAATVISFPLALGISYFLERSQSRWRGLIHTVVLLPLVLPPVVTGYLLLNFFSPRGSLGQLLTSLNMPVAFHWLGAVVAAAIVGFPLFVMSITLALKAVDPRFETISLSLGRNRWETFFRITLPLCWPGILSGAVLCFARGLGEFGATIILAGRIPGETETIPLSIYASLDAPGGEKQIVGLVLISIAICFVSVLASRFLDQKFRKRLELSR